MSVYDQTLRGCRGDYQSLIHQIHLPDAILQFFNKSVRQFPRSLSEDSVLETKTATQ